MNKNIIFAIGGAVVGGAVGFLAGKLTYKKKLDKAEMDINTLLKEINRPEEDSEVNDEDGTEEQEEDTETGKKTEAQVKEQPPKVKYSKESGADKVDYDSFYSDRSSGRGYKSNYILKEEAGDADQSGVDPAEREFPDDDSEIDEDEDWSVTDENGVPWESDEEREYQARQEMIDEGLLITKENENYEAGLEMSREMNSGRAPKVISADSYWDEYPHHAKCELEYYTENDVLVEIETEQEIDDEYRCVGNCLDKFGYRDDDMQSIIYVRNFSMGIDYEISKVFGSWEG